MKLKNNFHLTGLSSIHVAYYLTVLLYFVASFFPEGRIWAVNQYAFVSGSWLYVITLTALAIPVILARFDLDSSVVTEQASDSSPSRTYWLNVSLLIPVMGACYYFLRERTHFIGDGYQNLSLLASDSPFVKSTETGETLIHIWLKNFLGEGEPAALLSFQIISIVSGVLAVAAIAYFAGRSGNNLLKRITILTGIALGGHSLLFFGHVEYYSLFAMSVILYSIIGILVTEDVLPSWTIVPFLALSVFLHILGATLVPSALYLLVAPTRFGRSIKNSSRVTKWLLGLLVLVPAVLVFQYAYGKSYFFRLAILPLVSNRFTAEGYTLFSPSHLLDMLNLLMLLTPWLLLLTIIWHRRGLRVFSDSKYRFLIVLILSTLGAAFIFDPKLGMPRDSDLFSFVGVPICFLGFLLLFDKRHRLLHPTKVGILAISLALLGLLPRVLIQADPGASLDRTKRLIVLDRLKGKVAGNLVIYHYLQAGLDSVASAEQERWNAIYPDHLMTMRAKLLLSQGQAAEALRILDSAVIMNPINFSVWTNTADCYFRMGQYQQALTSARIASGLNPNQATNWALLGSINAYTGKMEEAITSWTRASELDGDAYQPHYNIASAYRALKKRPEFLAALSKAASTPTAPPNVITQMVDEHLKAREYEQAASLLKAALDKGLDTTEAADRIAKHPDLKSYFSQ